MAGPRKAEHCTQRERLDELGMRAAISVSVARSPSRSQPDCSDRSLPSSTMLGDDAGGSDAGSNDAGGDDAGSDDCGVVFAVVSTFTLVGVATAAGARGVECRRSGVEVSTGGLAGGTIAAAMNDNELPSKLGHNEVPG